MYPAISRFQVNFFIGFYRFSNILFHIFIVFICFHMVSGTNRLRVTRYLPGADYAIRVICSRQITQSVDSVRAADYSIRVICSRPAGAVLH